MAVIFGTPSSAPESSYAWVLGYVAITCGVGVVVPMDKELQASDIAMLLGKSDADAVNLLGNLHSPDNRSATATS